LFVENQVTLDAKSNKREHTVITRRNPINDVFSEILVQFGSAVVFDIKSNLHQEAIKVKYFLIKVVLNRAMRYLNTHERVTRMVTSI